MAVNDVLRAVGQWNVQLVPDAPVGIISNLDYFGHVAIVPGRMSPVEHGDELLTAARYVGILRAVEGNQGQITLSGVGMAAWLGDESGKGDVIETPGITLTGATFPAAVRAILPAHGAVTEGTFYSGISGTISTLFQYQTPRTALDYICTTMDPTGALGASWRVNGNGTLDAGPASSLFKTTPTCLIVRSGAGYDQTLRALPGQLDTLRDGKEYTSRVVLIASALAGGTADASVVPYNDIHGNPVHITRVIDEQSDTVLANAPARASNALAVYGGIQRTVRLTTDEFDIAGDFRVGDTIWVYDPDVGLVDLTKEVEFRGRVINPAAVSVLSLTWPVERGYTVGYRDRSGVWTDLTPWIAWESPGGGQIEVADSLVAALTPGVGTIGTQAPASGTGDAAIPGVPVFGTFSTMSYQPGDGLAMAEINVTWSVPLNTDSSTIVDGDHYEVGIRPTGTTNWQSIMVAFQQTSLMIQQLSPNTSYDFRIRAVDYFNPPNYGAWSAVTSFTSSVDTTPPATPDAPTVAASLIAIQVTHDLGLATGGTYNLPQDMDHFEVYVGTSSSFTPSTASLVGLLTANAAMIVGQIPAVGTFPVDTIVTAGATAWVRVIAVDKSGNRSTASAAASSTALLIDDSHIGSLTASKITAGAITAAVVIGGSATFSGALSAATGSFIGQVQTGTSGAMVTLNPVGRIDMQNASGASVMVNVDSSGNFTVTPSGGNFFNIGPSAITTNSSLFAGSVATNGISGNSLTITSGGASIAGSLTAGSISTAGSLSAGSLSTSGTVSASSGWSGAFSASSISTSGTLTASGTFTAQGTTVNLNPSGNVNATASAGVYITANSGPCNLSGSSQVNLACSGASVNLTSTTCNITSTAFKAQAVWSATSGTAANVVIASTGQLYQHTSSLRYKVHVTDMPEIPADDVLAMRPIMYYDKTQVEERDGAIDGLRHYLGVIAEEVAEIPLVGDILVTRDDDGRPQAVEYARIPVLLLPIIKDLRERVAALESAA